VTCCGDSCHFPVSGEGWDPAQLGGPSLLTNGSSSVSRCLGSGVIWICKVHGRHDDEATGGGYRDRATGGNGISSCGGVVFQGQGMTGLPGS